MMHDGLGMRPPPHYGDDDYSGTARDNYNATAPAAVEDVVDWLSSLSNRRSSSHHHHPDGFVMDVYALDFDGQGAALHSSTLMRQADFFARAVRTIAEGCRLTPPPPPLTGDVGRTKPPGGGGGGGITIVAHSVGALVVRMALRAHPELSGEDGWIRNVVALASPLGSDFPYAVDAGVRDAARLVNDGYGAADDDGTGGDVTMISISGGLRDEMIPPEACQVPSIPRDDGVDDDDEDEKMEENASGFVSSAFLASSIMQGGGDPTTVNDTFGMDHRAIVWCHDLLAVVRELIFSLVIATDNGLLSSERMNVATRMMHGARDGVGIDDPRRNESDATVYREQVNKQHVRLLLERGYLRTVSIQLSAPYYLNSLLKLSIAAALLDTLRIFPIRRSKSLVDASFDMALSLIAIPSLVVMVTWVRQSGHSCSVQECQLLSGTVFILSQLATLVYFVIVRGLCPLVAAIFRPRFYFSHAEYLSTNISFWGIFLRLIVEQLRMVVLVVLPLTIIACLMINTFFLGTEDLVWNDMAISSYCFISFILHNLISLVILATNSPSVMEQRRREIFVLFLSLVKSTLGTMMYALSLTTHWGQRDLDSYSYNDFLTVANSRTGFIRGRGNVLSMSVLTIVIPLFLAISVFRTHDVMTGISLFHWRQAKQKAGNGDTENGSTNLELESASKVMLWSYESKYITAVRVFLICWFTWTASVNMAADDIVVPISVVIMTYLRCLPFSVQAIGVCSSVINNELSLRSVSPQNHDKHK
jgi:pimeloyl-ACP methyl ester carboxylesterase